MESEGTETYETRSIGHCRCELSDGDIRNEVRHGITNSKDYQDQPIVTESDCNDPGEREDVLVRPIMASLNPINSPID
jgi:hypothetical protein